MMRRKTRDGSADSGCKGLRFLAFATAALTVLLAVLTAVRVVAFSRAFYAASYSELRTASSMGISQAKLDEATEALLNYLEGRRDDLDLRVLRQDGVEEAFFKTHEIAHMADVRDLYRGAMTLRNAAFGLLLLNFVFLLALWLRRGKRAKGARVSAWPGRLRQAYLLGVGFCLVVLAAVALYAALDFETFWTAFHRIFFRNDLWLLDPSSDRLIMMVPSAFFSSFIRRILLVSAVLILLQGAFWLLLYHWFGRPGWRRRVAVIFDLDGTLVDSIGDLTASVNALLRHRGLEAISLETCRSMVGSGIRNLCHRALCFRGALPERLSQEEEIDLDRALAYFKAHYKEHCLDQTKAYPGVQELIADLRARGIPMAVHSNKADELCQIIIGRLFPQGSFEIVSGMDSAWPKKPDPAKALHIARQLGVKPSASYVVGDSAPDIQLAANAGMPALAVTWGFRSREALLEAGATLLFDTPEELGGYFHKNIPGEKMSGGRKGHTA